MTESHHSHVYKETVQIGDTEMTIEYGDVNWGDFELPPMALEISGANYHAQLEAVRKFLSWQEQADAHSREEIERAKQLVKAASGEQHDFLNEDLIELWHRSVYEGATRSIAAAVMLAPLIESLFHRLALAIGRKWPSRRVPHEIMELVKDCELSPFPGELDRTLRALFEYRNRIFHWGLEWPADERREFPGLIRDSGWSGSWFNWSEDRDGPWVFYLTDDFVSHCLDLFEQVFEVVQKYIQNVDVAD